MTAPFGSNNSVMRVKGIVRSTMLASMSHHLDKLMKQGHYSLAECIKERGEWARIKKPRKLERMRAATTKQPA